MTIALGFLALLMGAVVFWLLRQGAGVRPWVAQASAGDVAGGAPTRDPARTALVVFLAVATSLFALFISAYAMRIQLLDWSPLPQPRLLLVNTAVLALASAAMEWTAHAARRGALADVRAGVLAAAVTTAAFVAGQLLVWKQMSDAGFHLANSAATAFFYLLTAVHGVHVLGGLVALARSAARALQGARPEKLRQGLELCAIYWHFLLAVWLVLLTVLVSGELGLSICSTT